MTVENTRRTPNAYFRRRYGYTSTKSPKSSSIEPETVSISGIATGRQSDQEHEPSIVDKKFSNSNQIDLGSFSSLHLMSLGMITFLFFSFFFRFILSLGSEIINQGLGEAITSISRAPLPFIGSTTVRNVKITSPGTIKYDDELDYQISKRADSLASGCKLWKKRKNHSNVSARNIL